MIGFLQAASVDDLTFTLNDDGVSYKVSDCDTAATGEMIIPSTYNSLPVTSIGDGAFVDCTSLTSMTIPNSVLSIGDYAFGGGQYDLAPLDQVTLPYKFAGSAGLFGIRPEATITVDFSDVSTGLLADTGFINGISAPIDAAIAQEAQTRVDADAALRAYADQSQATAEANANAYADGLAVNYDAAGSAATAEANANAYTDQEVADLQQQINDLQAYIDTAVAQARSEGVTAGIQSVTSDPQSYQLYSESSILEMNVSNPTLSMLNETQQAQVEFTLETSTDLEDWDVEERIQRTVQATGDKFFVRISSGAPYVTPTVLVFNHPSYGEILTDQSGNVLYGFSIDSAGGDPLYSGSAWPLASHSTDPEPDVDVTAALTSGTFSNTSGGPWLKINGRPVYTYVGDSEPNQASGHGLGSVWFTIKADGSLNQ
jgi:predicted lipoprotein with Yx(FWY)xxD motif